MLRSIVHPGHIFEELGFQYFGPVDGHSFDELLPALEGVKGKVAVLIDAGCISAGETLARDFVEHGWDVKRLLLHDRLLAAGACMGYEVARVIKCRGQATLQAKRGVACLPAVPTRLPATLHACSALGLSHSLPTYAEIPHKSESFPA